MTMYGIVTVLKMPDKHRMQQMRQIPDLPPNFSIEWSKTHRNYYYRDNVSGAGLYIYINLHAPQRPNIPDTWSRIEANNTYVRIADGLTLPYYTDGPTFELALANWRLRKSCAEIPRDGRHVTVVIMNTKNNTVLIGHESVYLLNPDGKEMEPIRFTPYLRGGEGSNLDVRAFYTHVRNVLTRLGMTLELLNRDDTFILPANDTVATVTELYIADITSRISIVLDAAGRNNDLHVKYILKNIPECSDIVFLQRKPENPPGHPIAARFGFPKGAVETKDRIDGADEPVILKTAARREVLEETLAAFDIDRIQYLGPAGDSHVCYIPISNAAEATGLLNFFTEFQSLSELFDLKFVPCHELLTADLRNYNVKSRNVIKHMRGELYDYEKIIPDAAAPGTPGTPGVVGGQVLFNICNAAAHGGKRRTHRQRKTRHRRRRTHRRRN